MFVCGVRVVEGGVVGGYAWCLWEGWGGSLSECVCVCVCVCV